MCGICGFTNAKKDDITTLKKMNNQMIHRGPDGEGLYISDGIALGHRRLSFIDIDGGDQPIVRKSDSFESDTWAANESNMYVSGQYLIVMNGEIYNYREIKEELEALGYKFKTKSDTEVLLVGYIEYKEKILNKLRGMFAFAIYDSKDKSLFCARDFFGIKPFYYTNVDNTFIFASEIKSILEHNLYKKELNMDALEAYLCFQFTALEETFFKNVFVLPAGCFIKVDESGNIEKHRYWRPKFKTNKKGHTTSEKYNYENSEELEAQINEIMKNSIKYHNIADVEIGAFLSSGIDSSYNAALLSQINKNTKTFTVGFDAYQGREDEYSGERNEIEWAKQLAEKLNIEHYSKTIKEDEYWKSLEKIVWHMDEPNGDPSAIALYFVDKLASKYVKGALSGEGADELFGGYTIYQTPLSSSKLKYVPNCIKSGLATIMKKLNLRGWKYLERSSKGVDSWYYTNAYTTAFNEEQRLKLLKNPTKKTFTTPLEITKKTYLEAQKDCIDEVTKMQYADLHFWILGDILLKGDKMSMANSIEARVPFLDTSVWDIARGLPTNKKVSSHQTKIALRGAAMREIPKDWANKKKLGFPVPIVNWLREDKYYNMVLQEFSSSYASEFFNVDYLVSILDDHKNKSCDNSRKIWIVYIFLLWYKIFFLKTK